MQNIYVFVEHVQINITKVCMSLWLCYDSMNVFKSMLKAFQSSQTLLHCIFKIVHQTIAAGKYCDSKVFTADNIDALYIYHSFALLYRWNLPVTVSTHVE